jgi:HlyD family secretion protein
MTRLTILVSLAMLVLSSCNNDEDSSDAYGNFEAVDVMVATESQGKLLAFAIEEGQKVQKGDIVGTIDTTQLFLKKQQLKAAILTVNTRVRTIDAQIRSAKVQLNILKRELERVKNLLKDGAATEKQKDDIVGKMEIGEAQILAMETQKPTIAAERESLKIQIDQVNDQISRASISNPINGVVLQKYKEAGEIVGPGQNLYKIADLSELILRAYISGDQLSQLEIGQEMIVRIDAENGIEELSGTVSWVSSEAEFTPKIIQTKEERVNLVYAIKVLVKNDGRLKIGMPAELKF